MIPGIIQEAVQAVPPKDASTAYDSIWAQGQTQATGALETVFLSSDKIYVVLVVVLLIWCGILILLYRTDRKIDRLERSLDQNIHGSAAP